MYFKKFIVMAVLSLSPIIAFSDPYLNVIDDISFGSLLGKTGSCELNAITKVIDNQSGNLCLYNETGTPGRYLIVSSSNKVIRIRINTKTNSGDGIVFVPSGVYRVTGEVDIDIVADQYQDISTGTTGILEIKLGGALTAHLTLSLASTFSFTNLTGIEWNELP
jgi:hypothetical protein